MKVKFVVAGTPVRSAVKVQRSFLQGGQAFFFFGVAMQRPISTTRSPRGAETYLLEKLPEPGAVPVHGFSGHSVTRLLLVTL